MSLRLFSPRRPLYFQIPRLRNPHNIRHNSTSSSSSSTEPPTSARINRILSRLPRFLHPYTSALRNAPVSHITSFLILHEITAIIPLIGLATAFHYAGWLPEAWVKGKWVNEGVERFGRYFGRKGWFGFTPPTTISTTTGIGAEVIESPGTGIAMDTPSTSPSTSTSSPATKTEGNLGIEEERVEEYVQEKYHATEAGTKILVEVAMAYAITKVLLPVRVVGSVWAAPWFARVVLGRFGKFAGRVRGKGRVGGKVGGERRGMCGTSGAAGTGATGGGAIGKATTKGGP